MSILGIWELFANDGHSLPYTISYQPNADEICHDISGEKMQLVFTFLPIVEKNDDLVWR